MFQPPEHSGNLSRRLSQVLDEIGVNEDLVMRRSRRSWMIVESAQKIYSQRKENKFNLSSYNFGSQTEGSTTLGLHSDVDILVSFNNRVITDWSEWEPNRKQYLMAQDDTVSPGYCLLQALRSDAPLPMQEIGNIHCSRDSRGRILLRHSRCVAHITDEMTRHGPAVTSAAQQPGGDNVDTVFALGCSTWPKEANAWLQQQNPSGWPTEEMKRYSAEQGCFVVPVASRTGVYQDLEWRISTSSAERCLMWNLNISQLRCYILMKMIISTFLRPTCGEAISSFMCKNILFKCIAESRACSEWNEGSLVTCVNQCLQALLNLLLTEHCPHFIIQQNNLLAGKLSAEVKHPLTEVMCKLTENIEQSLLATQIDDLGSRLIVKSGGISGVCLMSKYDIATNVAMQNTCAIVKILPLYINNTLKEVYDNADSGYQMLTLNLSVLYEVNLLGSRFDKAASSLYTPILCSHIGSITASVDILNSRDISREALGWFSDLNSDIPSGRLKLASALYCAGDLGRCETLLAALKRQLSPTSI